MSSQLCGKKLVLSAPGWNSQRATPSLRQKGTVRAVQVVLTPPASLSTVPYGQPPVGTLACPSPAAGRNTDKTLSLSAATKATAFGTMAELATVATSASRVT